MASAYVAGVDVGGWRLRGPGPSGYSPSHHTVMDRYTVIMSAGYTVLGYPSHRSFMASNTNGLTIL